MLTYTKATWLSVALLLMVALAGCPRQASAEMLMITAEDSWDISFTAHPDNATIEVFVECHPQGTVWRAAMVHDLEPEMHTVRLHRPQTPKGVECSAVAMVMRNTKHDHVRENSTIGESTLILFTR